jgi:uncharacterized protein with von Willebrand factor type A (vWA) domain
MIMSEKVIEAAQKVQAKAADAAAAEAAKAKAPDAKARVFSPHAEVREYESTLEKIDIDIASGKFDGAGHDG